MKLQGNTIMGASGTLWEMLLQIEYCLIMVEEKKILLPSPRDDSGSYTVFKKLLTTGGDRAAGMARPFFYSTFIHDRNVPAIYCPPTRLETEFQFGAWFRSATFWQIHVWRIILRH